MEEIRLTLLTLTIIKRNDNILKNEIKNSYLV